MRAFLLSVVVALVMGVGGWYVLGDFQLSVQEAFATRGVRL